VMVLKHVGHDGGISVCSEIEDAAIRLGGCHETVSARLLTAASTDVDVHRTSRCQFQNTRCGDAEKRGSRAMAC